MWRVIYKESPLLFFCFFSFSILSSRGKSHKTLMTYVLVLCRESREFISSVSFQKKTTHFLPLRAHTHTHTHTHTHAQKKRVTLKRLRVKAYYYERENVESGIEQSHYTTSEKETKRDFISLERKDEQGRNEFSGKTHPKGTGGNQFGTTDEL